VLTYFYFLIFIYKGTHSPSAQAFGKAVIKASPPSTTGIVPEHM
jgi:hypothetical protein